MAHSIFGWSYPPGCSGPPETPEFEMMRCKKCKAFISFKPDLVKGIDHIHKCNGNPDENYEVCGISSRHTPHNIVIDNYCEETRICKRCKHENKNCN